MATTGKFTANPGAGGDDFAADLVGAEKVPYSKLATGGAGVLTEVSAANPLPVTVGNFPASQAVTGPLTNAQLRATAVPISGNLTAAGTHFQPGYDVAAGVTASSPLLVDPGGNLVVRGQVLTDEGGYRVNFANSSLSVSIGTATFTNGSMAVTGTGFLAADLRTGDYVKLNADAESAWVQIETLDSDTSITLSSNYAGTGGTGAASRALIKPSTGSGGAIAVASGAATITSGTTSSVYSELERDVDWLPVVKQCGVTISQRIANQTTYIGFYDESAPSAPKWYAWFAADGTTNTSIRCESGRNPTGAPSGAEIETTTLTLPNGATTAVANRYRVEVLGDKVNFFINGILVATHYKAMPGPGDLLTSTIRISNGVAPASTTTVTVDYDTVINHNKIQVGLLSDTENVIASAAPLAPYSYSFTGVIAINTDLIVLDCSQLRSLYIQCTAMGTAGVVTVQWADDAAFTAPITATLLSESGATSTTFNAAVLRVTNVLARYCRLRLTTATTALTTTINVWGSQVPYVPIITTQPVSGTVSVTGYPTAAASADALANPTVTKVDATTLNFNGTTWDRSRNNVNGTTGDTGAKTASFAGATQTNFNARGAYITVLCGTVSGTTPTLSAQLQFSPDAGTTWINIGAASGNVTATANTIVFQVYPTNHTVAGATPAALTTGGTATVQLNTVLPRTWRLNYTIGGTTPSFAITAVYVNYVN